MNRVLIIGDVHGNLPALEKLFSVETDFDGIICHGDVVNYGPWSNECVQFLEEKKNCICLKGNHEDDFLAGRYSGQHPLVNLFFKFCVEKFTEKDTIQLYGDHFRLGNHTIQHTIDNKYIFADTELSSLDSNYIIGHSHQQFERKIQNFSLINTGSLGQNRSLINVANYLVYEVDKNRILLKEFVYDLDTFINKLESEKYPQPCIEYYSSKRRA